MKWSQPVTWFTENGGLVWRWLLVDGAWRQRTSSSCCVRVGSPTKGDKIVSFTHTCKYTHKHTHITSAAVTTTYVWPSTWCQLKQPKAPGIATAEDSGSPCWCPVTPQNNRHPFSEQVDHRAHPCGQTAVRCTRIWKVLQTSDLSRGGLSGYDVTSCHSANTSPCLPQTPHHHPVPPLHPPSLPKNFLDTPVQQQDFLFQWNTALWDTCGYDLTLYQ